MKNILLLILASCACVLGQTEHKALMLDPETDLLRLQKDFDETNGALLLESNRPTLGWLKPSSGRSWIAHFGASSELAFYNNDVTNPAAYSGYVNVLNCRWDGKLEAPQGLISAGHPVARYRGASTSDPASPMDGDMYWNSATSKLRIYAGAAWRDLN